MWPRNRSTPSNLFVSETCYFSTTIIYKNNKDNPNYDKNIIVI